MTVYSIYSGHKALPAYSYTILACLYDKLNKNTPQASGWFMQIAYLYIPVEDISWLQEDMPLDHKIHIFELLCNVLFILWTFTFTLTFTVLLSFVQPKQISLKLAYRPFLCIWLYVF